jgi:hypothetical protein
MEPANTQSFKHTYQANKYLPGILFFDKFNVNNQIHFIAD